MIAPIVIAIMIILVIIIGCWGRMAMHACQCGPQEIAIGSGIDPFSHYVRDQREGRCSILLRATGCSGSLPNTSLLTEARRCSILPPGNQKGLYLWTARLYLLPSSKVPVMGDIGISGTIVYCYLRPLEAFPANTQGDKNDVNV